MFPISNTGVSATYILATVHFFDMEYYFYQLAYRDSKVPKCFVGLIQIQCSPSFNCNWGKQNDTTVYWHQLHRRLRVLQQGKRLSYPSDCVGGITETPNCMGNSPHTHYLGQRAAEKPSTFLAIFMALCLTTITNILSAL